MGRKDSLVADRKPYKHPLVNFFGPPLRPEHRSTRFRHQPPLGGLSDQKGLAQNVASNFDLAPLAWDPIGSMLTALLRMAWPGPTRAIRPGTPARKGPGANGEGSAQVKPRYQGPYPVRLREQCSLHNRPDTQYCRRRHLCLQYCRRRWTPIWQNAPHMPLGIDSTVGARIHHTWYTW